jgi:hypothetical protein
MESEKEQKCYVSNPFLNPLAKLFDKLDRSEQSIL